MPMYIFCREFMNVENVYNISFSSYCFIKLVCTFTNIYEVYFIDSVQV